MTKHESGGDFWRVLVNRLLFATLLANVVVTIFITDRRESITQVILMAPLLVLIAGFKWYCRRTFDDNLHFYSMGLHGEENGKLSTKPKHDRVGVRFGHPALYKKLMVPMVHEKANHLLKEIIRDQSDNDLNDTNDYSDMYRLQKLPTNKSGLVDATGEATFEVVSESQMDIEHFRGREEEFDESGEGDDLHCNPSDPSRSSSPDSNILLAKSGSLGKEPDYEGSTYPTGYHPPRPHPLERQSSEISAGERPILAGQGGRSDVNLLSDVALLGKAAPGR